MERAVASGNPAALAAVRNEIAAAVAASAGISQQVRDDAQRIDATQLAAISAASHHQVQSLMRDMHRFDPCLRFASHEEEAEYRHRESERRAFIEAQQARGTPEGDLNAAGAAIGQMADAGSHGASNSPEFQQRWTELIDTTGQLRAAARSEGYSTAEFDENLRATLRARGLSDAEINARLALHPGNPLEAVRDIAGNARPAALATSAASPVQNIADAMAEFRAAGIVACDHTLADPPAHGLVANDRPVPAPGCSAR